MAVPSQPRCRLPRCGVRKKSLNETNPYLRDRRKRREGLITNVASSTAVETGRKPKAIARSPP